jgi:hypothetical protein
MSKELIGVSDAVDLSVGGTPDFAKVFLLVWNTDHHNRSLWVVSAIQMG